MKPQRLWQNYYLLSGRWFYLVGLWISCPLLSGKGYFLGVLMTATFGNYAYLRAEKNLGNWMIFLSTSVSW